MTLAATADSSRDASRAGSNGSVIYLDSNATTPLDPRVRDEVIHYMDVDFGNAGSRTHGYGQTAKERVNSARAQVAEAFAARPEEVFFTSGATESNNLALLGLAAHGEDTGRRHIVTTAIEHKAVLEPVEVLAARGFDVTLVRPDRSGVVDAETVRRAVREDTLLVSVMAVNNETGAIQPVSEIAELLQGHPTYFHTDAAQAAGKIDCLDHPRIDLISLSGHKVHAPQGVGALVARRRGYNRAPLRPLAFGGGQERGLRPGTLPVALIAGFSTAISLAFRERAERNRHCVSIRTSALTALQSLDFTANSDLTLTAKHVLNISVPGVDSEAAIVALKDLIAISNGSACTSQSYEQSHVLAAADLPPEQIAGALRFSWSHMTPVVPWDEIAARLQALR